MCRVSDKTTSKSHHSILNTNYIVCIFIQTEDKFFQDDFMIAISTPTDRQNHNPYQLMCFDRGITKMIKALALTFRPVCVAVAGPFTALCAGWPGKHPSCRQDCVVACGYRKSCSE